MTVGISHHFEAGPIEGSKAFLQQAELSLAQRFRFGVIFEVSVKVCHELGRRMVFELPERRDYTVCAGIDKGSHEVVHASFANWSNACVAC